MGMIKYLFGVVVALAVFCWVAITLGASYAQLTQVTGGLAVVVGAFAVFGVLCVLGFGWNTFIDDTDEFGVFTWLVMMVASPPLLTFMSAWATATNLTRLGELLFAGRFWSVVAIFIAGVLGAMGAFEIRIRATAKAN